jgi:ParB/RepB/Spo0J family partition protein
MSTAAATETAYQLLPLTKLSPHPANPRKHFDPAKMKELEASVRQKGVLVPLLVRKNGAGFEILAGERRSRAAKAAGLSEVPVMIRDLSDAEAREIVVFENLEREDLDPLEEADGYRTLMTQDRYTVARIAERLGCSEKYIYDRVKLLQLVHNAKTLLLSNRITAGHAILLARLKPDEQVRAIDPDSGGLFEHENADRFDFDEDGVDKALAKVPEDELKYHGYKARSVRELEGWIDQHVRFDRTAPIVADLFPETAATVKAAVEEKEKVVQVTHNHFTQPDAKEGNTERIYHVSSWTLADGSKGHKTCERSVTGVIVVGPDRGKAFKVCIDKKRCAVHWAKEQLQAKRRSVSGGDVTQQDRYKQDQARRQAEQAKAEAERNRWKKALPAILKAVAEKVQKAPAGAKGFLADVILAHVKPDRFGVKIDRETVLRGSTAEDLVRHAAFLALQGEAVEWGAQKEFPKRAKALGVDVLKILDEVAPVEKPKAEAEPAKPVQTGGKTKRKSA